MRCRRSRRHQPERPFAICRGERAVAHCRHRKQVLERLSVKGRAPTTGYARTQLGDGWSEVDGRDVCDRVLAQQLTDVRFDLADGGRCTEAQGDLANPYVPRRIHFVRGGQYANSVDLDHVVSLGDAWQTGAQQLAAQRRAQLANDPRNTAFRGMYVIRHIMVEAAYALWITPAEKVALRRVQERCPAG